MSNPIKDIGNVAQGLARNPLGIIALFIVLIYGFASLVVGASSQLQTSERLPIIWFMVLFPVVVIFVFSWLVSCHHNKLYAPSDYQDEKHFIEISNPDLAKLPYAKPAGNGSGRDAEKAEAHLIDNWTKVRGDRYKDNKNIFIAHILEPSSNKNQKYDIFIYLIRHKSGNFDDIEKAEFFFGPYWGNKVYVANKINNYIGIRTAAYGPFLAVCRISFIDGSKIILDKYIDFEMGFAVNKYINA